MTRDLIGYGKDRPKFTWPNDARLCVSLNVAYEEGAELAIGDGDECNEMLGEVTTLVPEDERDFLKESYFEYGSRVAIWRLLDMFERYNIQSSIFVNARAFERHIQVAQEITRGGHDLVGRGYRWIGHSGWTRDEEEADMLHAIDVLEKTSGQRPKGWMVRDGPTTYTYELMMKHGIVYDSHGLADDVPYYVDVKGTPLLVVPYSMEINDFRFFSGANNTGETFFKVMKEAFDLLYRESETSAKMISVGLHARVIGRPSRCGAIERFIKYAKGHPGVWFAKRSDIAEHWLQNYPPKWSSINRKV